jgi:hypothetical protein
MKHSFFASSANDQKLPIKVTSVANLIHLKASSGTTFSERFICLICTILYRYYSLHIILHYLHVHFSNTWKMKQSRRKEDFLLMQKYFTLFEECIDWEKFINHSFRERTQQATKYKGQLLLHLTLSSPCQTQSQSVQCLKAILHFPAKTD